MTKKFIVLSFSFAALLSLFSSPAAAQTYQWKDASGNTVVSSEPPPADATGTRVISSEPEAPSAPTSTSTGKSLAEKDLEFRQRRQAEEEAAERGAKEKELKRLHAENCTRAKIYLDALRSGQRTATRSESGEVIQMDDEMRASEITKVQADYDRNCVVQEESKE